MIRNCKWTWCDKIRSYLPLRYDILLRNNCCVFMAIRKMINICLSLLIRLHSSFLLLLHALCYVLRNYDSWCAQHRLSSRMCTLSIKLWVETWSDWRIDVIRGSIDDFILELSMINMLRSWFALFKAVGRSSCDCWNVVDDISNDDDAEFIFISYLFNWGTIDFCDFVAVLYLSESYR